MYERIFLQKLNNKTSISAALEELFPYIDKTSSNASLNHPLMSENIFRKNEDLTE